MVKHLIIGFIRFYQIVISPLWPSSCRFIPTCSSYFMESVRKHSLSKGIRLGLLRILKCHPFHPGGYDPLQ